MKFVNFLSSSIFLIEISLSLCYAITRSVCKQDACVNASYQDIL